MRLRSPFTSPNWIELKELNCSLFGFSRRDSGDVNALIIQKRSGCIGLYHVLLTLPTYCAEQGIYNGPVSVCPSVCPIGRQQQRRPASLLLSALRAGDVSR